MQVVSLSNQPTPLFGLLALIVCAGVPPLNHVVTSVTPPIVKPILVDMNAHSLYSLHQGPVPVTTQYNNSILEPSLSPVYIAGSASEELLLRLCLRRHGGLRSLGSGPFDCGFDGRMSTDQARRGPEGGAGYFGGWSLFFIFLFFFFLSSSSNLEEFPVPLPLPLLLLLLRTSSSSSS